MNLTLQTISSTIISEIMADSFLDGVVLDKEHGVFDDERLFSCIQTIKALEKKCFVRVACFDKQLIRMCLDSGVDGIIFSTVEDLQESKEIVEYCRYPKYGGRRGQGLVRENKWGNAELGTHNPILMAQIETKCGVENLDNIMSAGFDYFIVGPYDLSASLGCVAEWDSERYRKYYQQIESKICNSKLGLFLPSMRQINNFLDAEERPKILIWGMDTTFLIEGVDFLRRGIHNE